MNRILLTPIVALALSLAACSGSTSQTETSTASSAQAGMTKAPVAPQAKGHARVIADALSDVPLRADQRAEIEQMATDAQARHLAAKTAHVQVAEAIAAQIEAGAIDRAALQPKIDAVADALAATRPADQAAFERLHALLTPEQRGQFVDAMKAKHEQGKAMHHEHGMHARMEEWATDLKLTDDQRTQIAAIMKAQFSAHKAEMHEMHDAHAHGHEMMESFKADQMTAPPPAGDVRAKANKMADGFVAIAQQILPLLTPEQRTLAAAKIRQHAQSGEEEASPSFE